MFQTGRPRVPVDVDLATPAHARPRRSPDPADLRDSSGPGQGSSGKLRAQRQAAQQEEAQQRAGGEFYCMVIN